MTQHLTLAEVKANGLKALNENRLQFQLMMDGRMDRKKLKCFYRAPDHPDCGCVIGVSVQSELAKEIDDSPLDSSIGEVINLGYITVSDDEKPAILALQTQHDSIVSAIQSRDFTHEIEARINGLREALQP